ncbi:unnamed protein product [Sympodiomycopsis kandeliae]
MRCSTPDFQSEADIPSSFPPIKDANHDTRYGAMTEFAPRTITYRHLVSAGTLNASNPLRVISLVDVDAAYAQFEARRLGIPREVPLIAVQWQGVLAISYSARKYGITRHENVDSAKEKCPHIKVAHVATYGEGETEAKYHDNPKPETHKVSLDPYRRESRKIVAIFNELCPLGAVEKASIDELYCDLTLAVRQLILQRFPHLARPPPDSPLGLDTPLPEPPEIHWSGLGNRMPTTEAEKQERDEHKRRVKEAKETKERLDKERADKIASGDIDPEQEQQQEMEDPLAAIGSPPSPPQVEQAATWTDYALACGAELISVVRKAVFDRLGYTMTAGIASNKTIAKLCASENKPDNQTVVLPAAVPLYLRDMPFQNIRFLGGKLGDAIASEWTYSTVGDLWSVSLIEMQQKFGDESRWVYDVLRGIDHSPVIERTKNKTMLASKNVKPPIRTQKEAQRWLSILSLELSVRLKEAREESPTLWPSTIVLRYLKSRETARSRQSVFPFVKDLQPEHVLKIAQRLWDEAVGDKVEQNGGEIVTIALGFSGLEAGEQGQKSIEGFFGSGSNVKAQENNAVGNIGVIAETSSVKRSASPVLEADAANEILEATQHPPRAKKMKRHGLESLFQKAAAASSSRETLDSQSPPIHEDSTETTASDSKIHSDEPTWTCPDCQKVIRPLPRNAAEDADIDPSDVQRRLTLAQQDHQDFHFAMELQRQANAALMPRGSLSCQQVQQSQQSTQSNGKRSNSSQANRGKRASGGGKPNGSKAGLQNFFKRT